MPKMTEHAMGLFGRAKTAGVKTKNALGPASE